MANFSQLIDIFKPEHYQLSINLDRTERRFDGTVTIQGESSPEADKIILHAKDLEIQSVTFDGKQAEFTSGDNDELIITHSDISAGNHLLVIRFNGQITDAMHGLYPCYYQHDGQKKELLATQFESHHAREVFPCIDEPAAKSTFDLVLTTEQNVTVLSNMPVKQQYENPEDNCLVTSFETTPRMSTYLLAWVVGEMQHKTARTKDGIEVNVWSTPAQPLASLDFALDIATRTIEFFNDYFDTPYPLPKSDHVALPDFSSGAMENWGLVTYREVALLADPDTTSVSSKHYIATVIAHELSHQWFGNLVTMKWWNDLWLNESFATLMEYIAIDALEPDWNVWLDFATMESILALRRDAIDGVQPVQIDVNHPDEISTLFDGAIVYAKGARLLRMLQNYVGHEDFQTGLKSYFAKHAYENTQADDLWQALSESSNKNIANFMQPWLSQSGYPVVSMTCQDDVLSLEQKQFIIGPHQDSGKTWPVPLNSTSTDLPELLDAKQASFKINPDEAIRLNAGDTAHFITNYDEVSLQKILESLKNGELDTIDRAQLLHEQTLLARGGVISSAQLITLLEAYKNETTEAVWDIISLTIGELKKFVEDDPNSEARLRQLSADLARGQFERLGMQAGANEPATDTKLRATILGLMLYGEDESVIRGAKELYDQAGLGRLDPELRSLIIGAVVRHSESEELISELVSKYQSTSSAELQQDIASGLTSTKSPDTAEKLLGLITDSGVIRTQDTARWFVWLIRNRHTRATSWQWLQNNWNWIEKTFAGDKSYDDFPRYAASSLSTRQQLEEFKNFFGPMQDIPALTRVISIGASEIEGRVESIERDKDAVRERLGKI